MALMKKQLVMVTMMVVSFKMELISFIMPELGTMVEMVKMRALVVVIVAMVVLIVLVMVMVAVLVIFPGLDDLKLQEECPPILQSSSSSVKGEAQEIYNASYYHQKSLVENII